MKTIHLLLIALCLPLFSIAQKVKINDDIVSADGKDLFKIEGKMGMVSTSFSIYNLDGDLLMAADGRNENNFMTVTFTGSNASLDYPLTIGLKKIFAKELVQMQVIKDGQLNPDGVKRFVAKYNGRADKDVVLTESNTRNTVVIEGGQPRMIQRNRDAIIFIAGNTIKQDNKVIGSITSSQKATNGTIMYYYTIMDVDGNVIADASKAMDESVVDVVTYNRRNISLHTKKNIDLLSVQKFIVEELIHKGIL